MIVVIPMAGRGSRYLNKDYKTPKPFIEVAGKPMILWALKSVEGMKISKFIFIVLREHEDCFKASQLISEHTQVPSDFVFLPEVTEGQLCTVLAGKHLMKDDEDLLIASSDTFVKGDFSKDIEITDSAGIISVAHLSGEQWSFAKINSLGEVVEVAEKKRISDFASTGLYYFRKASILIEWGEKIIKYREKTRGEYYIIPVYQKMIEAGLKVGISVADEMWDMGTPEAKIEFEKKFKKRQ